MRFEDLERFEIHTDNNGEPFRYQCSHGDCVEFDSLPQKVAVSVNDKPLDNEIVALYWDPGDKASFGWRFGIKWFSIYEGKVQQVATPTHFRELLR